MIENNPVFDPRLRLDSGDARLECFLCGRNVPQKVDGKPNAPYCEYRTYPKLYFHPECADGRHPEVILSLYLDEIHKIVASARLKAVT